MKKIAIVILSLLPLAAFSCGEFKLQGILKAKKNELVYIVSEGARSEKSFTFEDKSEFMKLTPFLNQTTSIVVTMNKPMDGTSGKIDKVMEVKKRFPNPLLDNEASNFNFIKKCSN